jgi:hypothetical protein
MQSCSLYYVLFLCLSMIMGRACTPHEPAHESFVRSADWRTCTPGSFVTGMGWVDREELQPDVRFYCVGLTTEMDLRESTEVRTSTASRVACPMQCCDIIVACFHLSYSKLVTDTPLPVSTDAPGSAPCRDLSEVCVTRSQLCALYV